MSEAQPSKKVGGHAYGRRKPRDRQLSNTAEEGELCIYTGHALGRFSSHSMRYDSHAACTRCVAAAREGRMSFDINRLLKKHRKRALKFWSQVDIAGTDDCWTWNGVINPKTKQPQFAWRRPGISSSTVHHPQRVAMWLTWGDLGFTGVKTTCGNKYCCNPFHLIPQGVGVFVDHDSYMESFELATQLHTLRQEIAAFVMEEALEREMKDLQDQTKEIEDRADLILNPDSGFDQKFEAVMLDLLGGRHPTQIDPESEGLYREPVDNDSDEPTDLF